MTLARFEAQASRVLTGRWTVVDHHVGLMARARQGVPNPAGRIAFFDTEQDAQRFAARCERELLPVLPVQASAVVPEEVSGDRTPGSDRPARPAAAPRRKARR